MPDKQGIYRIEKQEAGRDLYNVAGSLVIQHPITHEPVYIPTIQSVLRKDETTDGDFFKKEPEWVDYEQGFIVERKEVDEIINRLEKDKIQLVLGNPASGKSICLKNVGYKLAKENKDVYYVELKEHQREDVKIYFDTITQLNDDNPIFIVDDAHLYFKDCERLIRDFKSKGHGKLIIGSRPTEEILPKHPKKTSEFKFLNKTEIHAIDITEGIINAFLEKQYHFDHDRINTVSDNLVEYKNDLWQLSWAIKAYKPEKDSVNIDEIYENIIISITEIETKEGETISAEDVFLPLSIFFRFEIPIERDFLVEQLDIEEGKLNKLIELSEVVETREKGNRLLSLHHSSLAELYFGAYKKYDAFGKRIKKKILNERDEKDLEYCSFYRYLTTTDSRNTVDVVNYLDRHWWDGGLTLLENLIEIDKIQKSVINGLDKEEDLEKIGNCVSRIAQASEEVAMKLLDSVSSKIKTEKDIEKIGGCVGNIVGNSAVGRVVGLKLVNSIDTKALSLKIDKEEDILKIGSCVGDIAYVSGDVALELVDSVSPKIDKEEDIGKILWCIKEIAEGLGAEGNTKVAMKLVECIDINVLSSKIDNEEDLENIGECVRFITWLGGDVGLKLVNSIDTKALSLKIDKEEDILKIGSCVGEIAEVSKKVSLKLVKKINTDYLSSKIDKEEDIGKVESCVSRIANQEVAMKLLDSVSSIIDKEKDIEKIGRCVESIALKYQEVSLELVKKINIDSLSSKIDKEEDIGTVEICVYRIALASKEVAIEIVDQLNSKLRGELKQMITELYTPRFI